MKNYRTAFILTLTANVLLIALLASLWTHYRALHPSPTPLPQGAMSPSTQDSTASPALPASSDATAPMPPIQVSPQRLQSIGVKIGEVQRKSVHDEIDTTGSVAV